MRVERIIGRRCLRLWERRQPVSLVKVTRGMLSAPARRKTMPYRITGIDVHKKMLAVVVSDVEVDGEYEFTRRLFGTYPEALRSLAEWLLEQEAEEVVMESTAQYWRPVWETLERYWKPICQKREGALPTSGTLHLAQAQSNRGRRGRKRDFPDAERLVKRLVSNELVLSFVPDAEQRLWRTVTRRRYQLTRNRVQVHNRLESLLEEAHIKLSSLVSDLLGASSRRMLKALAEGETDPATLAALAGLSGIAEVGIGGVALDRATYRSIRSGDSKFAHSASGCGAATGGSARSRCRFGTPDHCRSRCQRCDLCFAQGPFLVGGGLPWRRGERGS